MARVWFIVAVFIHIVYAEEIGNCDECMRRGDTWCKKLGSDHCMPHPDDDWCPNGKEKLPSMPVTTQDKHATRERRLYVGIPARLEIPYDSQKELQTNVSIVDSSQSKNIEVSVYHTKCTGSQCIATIEATPNLDFCFSNGTVYEYAYAKVTIENMEDVTIKYHIACACMCSKDVQVDSMDCNGHGNLTCGVCTCRNGWSGTFCETKMRPKDGPIGSKGSTPSKGEHPNSFKPESCIVEKTSAKCNYKGDYSCGVCNCHSGSSGKICETKICPDKRGDSSCTNPMKHDVECSGNGYCNLCDTCVCYNDREGSQYFDENNYCTDLCMIANNCDTCLINNTIGPCPDCNYMAKFTYNETLTHLKDNNNSRVWVKCNETVEECYVEYWAMRDENDEISIMVERSCNDVLGSGYTAGPNVSWIMGILGIIAAVAAVTGVIAWKHFNTVPPMPLSDPEYQNIDAEDCTGENPLYKSPMSSFKNPTYGKW